MRDKSKIQLPICAGLCVLFVLFFGVAATGQKQSSHSKLDNQTPLASQALYKEYRGVRLGMTAAEARSKLGEPSFKGEDLDFYIFSENETAQIAYNTAHKVVTISTDYVGGIGAPDYKTVLGTELEDGPNGAKYKMIHYDSYWVSYNKSLMSVVTVTIQAVLK